MEQIESLTNGRVKDWTKLKNKKYRDETNLFLVEGEHLVIEALKANLVKEIILLQEVDYGLKVPKFLVTEAIMKKITGLVSCPTIVAVCYKKKDTEIGSKVLLIDALQDPGNLGTIIRSAVAFKIDTIIIGQNSVDLYNEKVIRASEGMLFKIDIIMADLPTIIKQLNSRGYQIYGTDVRQGKVLKKIKFDSKVAIVIGNEGNGLSPQVADLCAENIYIPMADCCESLNAAMATTIILYEMAGQDD